MGAPVDGVQAGGNEDVNIISEGMGGLSQNAAKLTKWCRRLIPPTINNIRRSCD